MVDGSDNDGGNATMVDHHCIAIYESRRLTIHKSTYNTIYNSLHIT